MGILHSIIGISGCKPEDEHGDRRNHNGESMCSSILRAIKGLLQSLCSVFNFTRPRKRADNPPPPVLPIQNPASSIRNDERELQCEKTDHVVDFTNVVPKERWIKHYSSGHTILLVGEGNFSFSASLAVAFGRASNIISTSLDSEAFLRKNYSTASSNIEKVRSRGGKVMHEIDATKMANHPLLRHLEFDRIVFNFPYAGFQNVKKLTRESQLRCHWTLVDLFLRNAREMINENGEIHISHKTNYFHVEFKVESIASCHGLRLIEAINFNFLDYPGYNTKCGFGGDNNFNCNPSNTFKFGIIKVQC